MESPEKTCALLFTDIEGCTHFWCGYEPNPANVGGGCHKWIAGYEGQRKAIRFLTPEDALRSGVGAPNTPYGRADTGPGRGVAALILYNEP